MKIVPTSDRDRRHQVMQRWILLGILVVAAVMVGLAPTHLAGGIAGIGTLGIGGMLVDAQCLLSDAQALTATALSTNTYDTGTAGNAMDIGNPMCICFCVGVAADLSSGDETYRFSAVQSANANLSSSDELVTTNVLLLTKAVLVAGYKFYLPIPPGLKTKRYIGANYTLGGTTPSITVDAFIQPLNMIQNDYINASGFTVNN